MGEALTSGGLAPWGQAAAFIIALYIFFSLIAGLALAVASLMLLAWLREKAEQIKKLRPLLGEVNQVLSASQRGETPPSEMAERRFAGVAARIPAVTRSLPAQASAIGRRTEEGSDRVAGMVIEFHARTQQATGFIKALFLPGLTRRQPPVALRTPMPTQSERAQEVSAPRQEPPQEQNIVITQSSR